MSQLVRFVKGLAQELVSLQKEQDLLRLKVDSMTQDIKQQSLLVSTLVMTLKNTSLID